MSRFGLKKIRWKNFIGAWRKVPGFFFGPKKPRGGEDMILLFKVLRPGYSKIRKKKSKFFSIRQSMQNHFLTKQNFCSKIDFFHWKFFISSQFWWKYWNFGNFGEKIWKFSIFKISYNDENQRFLAFSEPNWIVLVPCRFRIF